MRWLAVLAAVCACRSNTAPLYPAGSDKDDGHGLLAQASTQILVGDDTPDRLEPTFGGAAYGGAAYGGTTYAGYVVPSWPVAPPNRSPKYNQVPNLAGAIEGTVAIRAPVKLPCGAAPPRVAIVYIEKVQVGRIILNEGRPAIVGGTLVKRGCALAPSAQIVTPLPAALAIHGDDKPAKLRVNAHDHELQAGGRVALPLQVGVTRVELERGGAAWLLALDAPYYAITDDHGRYRLDELAAGTYEVTIWQPPLAKVVDGNVTYGEPIVAKRTVRVDARRSTRLDIK